MDIIMNILLSWFTILAYGSLTFCCVKVYKKKFAKPLSILGTTACILACIYFLLMAWNIVPYDYQDMVQWKLIFFSFMIPIAFTHLCLLSLITPKNKPLKIMLIVTIVLAAIVYMLVILEMVFYVKVPWQIFFPAPMLISFGTIAVPLLNSVINMPTQNNRQSINEQNINEQNINQQNHNEK